MYRESRGHHTQTAKIFIYIRTDNLNDKMYPGRNSVHYIVQDIGIVWLVMEGCPVDLQGFLLSTKQSKRLAVHVDHLIYPLFHYKMSALDCNNELITW